jgi:hypothetical protein
LLQAIDEADREFRRERDAVENHAPLNPILRMP